MGQRLGVRRNGSRDPTTLTSAPACRPVLAYAIRNDSGSLRVGRDGMTGQEPELMAYHLLALYGAKAIDLVIRYCDEAARLGAEETLSFWNDVLNVMYGWE
jgi:hypothetical protein